MERLEWNDHYSTGHYELDCVCRELVAQFNELLDNNFMPKHRESVTDLLESMIKYGIHGSEHKYNLGKITQRELYEECEYNIFLKQTTRFISQAGNHQHDLLLEIMEYVSNWWNIYAIPQNRAPESA